METENFLFSVDGPNGIGKGGILERARIYLEVINFINFSHYGTIPFRTATITEPPQLPITAYVSHPSSRMPNGSLITWRNMLKEGYSPDLLAIGAPDAETKAIAFAEGFFTSRAIIERYMFEEFPWTFACELNPFINMLPNIFYRLPGGREWFDLQFDKVVIKDRGSASTAVFQGEDAKVRELMEKCYLEGDLMMEDLTVLLLPSDRDRWIKKLTSRIDDRDVHDGKFNAQANRYFNLRNSWKDVFSKNIVHLFNDPSGETNKIETPSIMLALLCMAYRQNGSIKWFDNEDCLNALTVPLEALPQLLKRVYYVDFVPELSSVLSRRAKHEFQGIPLTIVCGDVGLVANLDDWGIYNDKLQLVIAEDLHLRVNSVR